jgi:hypothetical protein
MKGNAVKAVLSLGRFLLGMVLIVALVSGSLLLTPAPKPFRVGENLIYGAYLGGDRVGVMNFWIEGEETFGDARCYVVRYSLEVPVLNAARAGRLLIDGEGKLRHAKIAYAEGGALRWATEIGYSYALGVMRVIVEDNRAPENFSKKDDSVVIPGETFVPAHLWYLLRTEEVEEGYERRFFVNLLPDATEVMRASVTIVGIEDIATPAGTFDAWVVEGENIAEKLWIERGSGVVVKAVIKAVERVEEVTWTYVLEKRT